MILGKVVSRPSHLDRKLAEEIMESKADQTFSVVLGTTMCTDDFYEGKLSKVEGEVFEWPIFIFETDYESFVKIGQ